MHGWCDAKPVVTYPVEEHHAHFPVPNYRALWYVCCTRIWTTCQESLLGMLIPGKLHSRVESRNSQVSIETLDFARTIGRHFGRSAHLMSTLMQLWTVIFLVSYIEADWSGRICSAGPMQWRNYGYQLTAAETSVPCAPYHLDTPLSLFRGVGVRASGMRATAAVKLQAIDW